MSDAAPAQELGTLADGWIEKSFGALFDVQQGKQVSKKNRQGLNQRPFLRTKNVLWDQLDLAELDQMHFSEEEQARYALESGDLLVCEGGDIGRTARWGAELADCHFQNHLHRARLKDPDEADDRFFLYWLWYAFELGGVYFGRGNTTTIPNLSKSSLRALPVPVPPLTEQERIADVLELVRERRSIQQHAWRSIAELKRALLHRQFVEGAERGDPSEWITKPIKSIATLRSGGTPSRSNETYWSGGTIPWVKTSEVDNGIIYETEERITQAGLEGSAAKLFPPGTLLVAMYGQGITRGKVAILGIEATTNQACLALFPNDELTPEYLFYLLQAQYHELREHGHGANQKNLSGEIVGSFEITFPTGSDRQAQAVELLRAVDSAIEVARARLSVLDELFRSLLHELMTGELQLTEAGLPDEEKAASAV